MKTYRLLKLNFVFFLIGQLILVALFISGCGVKNDYIMINYGPVVIPPKIDGADSVHLKVEAIDPLASKKEVHEEYGVELIKNVNKNYDAVVVAVAHEAYNNYSDSYFKSICKENSLIIDLKGIYRDKIKKMVYWSL